MRRLLQRPGLAARIVMALACALVVHMYWTNEDNAGMPDAVRGRGEYLPILDRGDGHMLYLMARSTALDFDWAFNNDLAAFGDPWGQAVNPQGRKQIPHPVGPPLIWTPLIWIAQAGAQVRNWLGGDVPMHGYTEWHQRFVFLSSVGAALLAVILGRRLARDLIGGRWAPTYAAVAVLLGTSITYYATYMPSYGHALDAGASGAFLGAWALTLGRFDARRIALLGICLGIAMLIRVQDVAFGVAVVIEVVHASVVDLRERKRDWLRLAARRIAGGLCVLAVALVVFVPQLYYWHVVYGEWLALPQGPRYTRPGSPMILELLYAPRNGWFSTTPIAYLAVLGLPLVPRRARLVALGFGSVLSLQVYLNASILDWWGMAAWGQRRLCSVTLILVFGLTALLWRLGTLVARLRRVPRGVWHVPAVAVLGGMIAWNLWRVRDLRAGKGAPSELEPTCCEKTPRWARGPLSWVYARIGNPFEFPANALYAVRHDVEIQRWDHAVGYYALMPSVQSMLSDAMYRERGAWRIGYPKSEPYLIGQWSAPHTGDEKFFRWTVSPTVRAIVPNLMPYGQRFLLEVAPGGSDHVTLRWDGDEVASTTLHAGWQVVSFDVPRMPVGEHELTIEAAPGPFPGNETWPKPRLPVGVAIGRLDVEFLPP